MKGKISRFATISRYEANLRQSPVVIECLVNVLEYIKTVLADDGTATLVEMINHHFQTKDDTAHHINFDLMSDQLIDEIYATFIEIGIFTNNEALRSQFVTFFRDIYDGSGYYTGTRILEIGSDFDLDAVIPRDRRLFLRWLLKNPEVFLGDGTDDFTDYTKVVTVKIVDYILSQHDLKVDAHQAFISNRLAGLMVVSSVAPSYQLNQINFGSMPYKLIGSDSYNRVIALLITRLIDMGSPDTIDFTTYDDTMISALMLWYDEETLMADTFLRDIYDEAWLRVIIMQLNRQSIKALYLGGAVSFAGYGEFLSDYGEDDGVIFGRKFINYYSEHLRYVLSNSMTPEYRSMLADIRGNVNTNFCKCFSVFTVLNKHNSGLNVALSIGKLTQARTLDLLNMTGLSKSIVCLSLIPYVVAGVTLNKVVVAFDNYNPAFTEVLLDGITGDRLISLNITISMSRTELRVHTMFDNQYSRVTFANVGRLYDVDPFTLFTVPRIDSPRLGKIRLSGVKLYGKAISDDDALAIIS